MQLRSLLATVCLALCAACAHKRAPSQPTALGTGSGPASHEAAPVYAANAGPSGGAEHAQATNEAAFGDDRSSASQALGRRDEHSAGLGTAYGEQRHSKVVNTAFVRGGSHPDVTLEMRYNDAANVARFGRTVNSSVATPDQTFVLSLVDERGRELPAVDIDRKRYAIGRPGARYLLGIENHSAFRYEVVASVDGLDVIDGSDAGFGHRGYILEPFSSLVIDGWRTSDDTVAAFRFSSIEHSYAERLGKGRNIGVIGAAFFHEESGRPWSDLDARHDADPFPSRYAPPPPPGW